MTLMRAQELHTLVADALVAARTSPDNARLVAEALVQAEIDGQKSHGLSRVASYAAQARSGKVDGFAMPSLAQPRSGALLVDAAHGFAYPALDLAIAALPDAARRCGIAMAGIRRSHHFGVAGRVVERLAEQGLVALVVGNTPKAMAAWGGRTAVFGTNPLAFAAPIDERPPLVVDLALSAVARGKIMTAAQRGESIPEGWATDGDGRPTTDAKAALSGLLTPAGGAKGAALALMVEILAAALTGALLSTDATSFFDDKGSPPGVGQLLIAIDPGALAGKLFDARISTLVGLIAADGARLPGDRRLALRARAADHGVDVDDKVLAEIRDLAGAS